MNGEFTIILNFINMAVLASAPLLLATLGEILTEKSGNLNLGVEGMMFMGAIASLGAAYSYEQAVTLAGGLPSPLVAAIVATLAAAAAGALGALIYAFLVVTLRANQNVTGLTLTIFGTGFANFFGELIGKQAGGFVQVSAATKAMFGNISFGPLSDIPVLGPLLFEYNWMVYFGLAVMFGMTPSPDGLLRFTRAIIDAPRVTPLAVVRFTVDNGELETLQANHAKGQERICVFSTNGKTYFAPDAFSIAEVAALFVGVRQYGGNFVTVLKGEQNLCVATTGGESDVVLVCAKPMRTASSTMVSVSPISPLVIEPKPI